MFKGARASGGRFLKISCSNWDAGPFWNASIWVLRCRFVEVGLGVVILVYWSEEYGLDLFYADDILQLTNIYFYGNIVRVIVLCKPCKKFMDKKYIF